jgi:hypothetical protein
VFLEFTPASATNNVLCVRRDGDLLAILDFDMRADRKNIKIFTTQGQYIRTLAGSADAPVTFPHPKDIQFNKGVIDILDIGRMVSIDARGFPSQKSFPVKTTAYNFVKFTNENFAIYRANAAVYDTDFKSHNNLVYLQNANLQKDKQYARIHELLMDLVISGEVFFKSKTQNGYYFNDFLNDTIFLCQADAARPYFTLACSDLNKKHVKSFLNKGYKHNSTEFTMGLLDLMNNKDMLWNLSYLADIDQNQLLISFDYQRNLLGTVNLKEQKIALAEIETDLFRHHKIFQWSDHETAILIQEPISFKEKYLKLSKEKRGNSLEGIMAKIKDDDTNNPSLFIIDNLELAKLVL